MWFISLSNHIGRSGRDGAVFSTLARWLENRISPGGSKISLQPDKLLFIYGNPHARIQAGINLFITSCFLKRYRNFQNYCLIFLARCLS